MARTKSRKRSGNNQNKNASVVNNKAEIAAMIDARRLEQKKKGGATNSKGKTNKVVDAKLEKEFKDVLQRFQVQENDTPKEITKDEKNNHVSYC